MISKDIQTRFNELNNKNSIECSKNELEEFLYTGLLFKKNKGFVDRFNKPVKITVYEPKCLKFNIDLSGLIYECNKRCKENKINKIYCMSKTCYNNYKEQGLIITKNETDYFRLFDKELWLIYIIDKGVEE